MVLCVFVGLKLCQPGACNIQVIEHNNMSLLMGQGLIELNRNELTGKVFKTITMAIGWFYELECYFASY